MRNRLELTRQLVQQLSDQQWTVDMAMMSWWYNIRDTGGMRLSRPGYDIFVKELKIESYDYVVPSVSKFTPGVILALDRRLQDPYYIAKEKNKFKLIFFGSREAVLVNLYGDLEKFLNSYT